ARQDDRLVDDRRRRGCDRTRRLYHCVGAVCDYDPRLGRLAALLDDDCPVGGSHFETVNHHECPDRHIHTASPEPQHLWELRVFERQHSCEFVVLLVERAARDKDSDGRRYRVLVLGCAHLSTLAFCTWHAAPGTRHQVRGTWHLAPAPSTQHAAPST